MMTLMDQEIKPGYKTSEFWITISILIVSSGLTAIALFFAKTKSTEIVSGVIDLAAILKAHAYSAARAEFKKLWIQFHSGHPTPTPVPTPPIQPAPMPIPVPVPVPVSVPLPIEDNNRDVVVVTTKTSRGVTTTTMKVQ